MARRAAEIAELCFSAYSAPLRETCKEGLRKNERIALKQVQCNEKLIERRPLVS
jgi:hypothetical protein